MTHRIQAFLLAAALLAALSGCKPQAQPAEPPQESPTETAQTAETPSAAPQEPDAAAPPEPSGGEAQPAEPSAQATPYEGLVLDENEIFIPAG